jgi:inosine-uridine nucleoside N-ribohydrolase
MQGKEGERIAKKVIMVADTGVDDAVALQLTLAKIRALNKTPGGTTIELLAVVPSMGNALVNNTLANTACMAELAQSGTPVYQGASVTLSVQCNETLTKQQEEDLNNFGFYGKKGFPDSIPLDTICPDFKPTIQPTKGYKFIADTIENSDTPITLLSTCSLTEISKALSLLMVREQQKGLAAGTLLKKIDAIYAMGGVLKYENANAPFGWNLCDGEHDTPPCMKSEANVYYGLKETQITANICREFDIRIILATLDLTQHPKLMWSKVQSDFLANMPKNNAPAQQLARITSVIPEGDKKRFGGDKLPMHDALAAMILIDSMEQDLSKKLFNITMGAYTFGDVSNMIHNPDPAARKNIGIATIRPEMIEGFWNKRVLPIMESFNDLPNITVIPPKEPRNEENSKKRKSDSRNTENTSKKRRKTDLPEENQNDNMKKRSLDSFEDAQNMGNPKKQRLNNGYKNLGKSNDEAPNKWQNLVLGASWLVGQTAPLLAGTDTRRAIMSPNPGIPFLATECITPSDNPGTWLAPLTFVLAGTALAYGVYYCATKNDAKKGEEQKLTSDNPSWEQRTATKKNDVPEVVIQ